MAQSSPSSSRRKEPKYTEWDPPAPATVYCKIEGITWARYRYLKAKGLDAPKIYRIQDALSNGEYKCEVCVNNFGSSCRYQDYEVEESAICKSFDPQPDIKYGTGHRKQKKTKAKTEPVAKKKKKTKRPKKTKSKKSKPRKGIVRISSQIPFQLVLGEVKEKLNKAGGKEIILQGHGEAINRAVSIAEIIKKTEGTRIVITDINIGSEFYKKGLQPTRVSFIEIHMKWKHYL